MTEEYDVKITEQAKAQMREIVRYFSIDLQMPDTSLRLLNTLEKGIASLAWFPNRIALTEEEPWRGYGIHKLLVKNFLVYFWIDEAARKVQVTAVVHGSRDQVRQLSQMGLKSDKAKKMNLGSE